MPPKKPKKPGSPSLMDLPIVARIPHWFDPALMEPLQALDLSADARTLLATSWRGVHGLRLDLLLGSMIAGFTARRRAS